MEDKLIFEKNFIDERSGRRANIVPGDRTPVPVKAYACPSLSEFNLTDDIKDGDVIVETMKCKTMVYMADHSKTPPFVPVSPESEENKEDGESEKPEEEQ